MISFLRPVAALILVLLMTAGCGQRGPLYLPGDPNEGRTEIPGQEQDEEDADEAEQTDQSPRSGVTDD